MQTKLLGRLHEEMGDAGGEAYLRIARSLAEAFGAVTAVSVESLVSAGEARAQQPGAPEPSAPQSGIEDVSGIGEVALPHGGSSQSESRGSGLPEEGRPGFEEGGFSASGLEQIRVQKGIRGQLSPLRRSREMRRRLDQLVETYRRYGHPFGLAVFDFEGPSLREGNGSAETVRTVVGAALHDSVRLLDDTFRLEEDGLCVLAPNQNTVGGVQMAERLLRKLDELEAVGGLRIGISAGVVACPDHGTDAELLLQKADEGLWRARAVGEPVGVGPLQDRSQIGEIRP